MGGDEKDWLKETLVLPQTASTVQTFRAAISHARVAAAEARGETVPTADIINIADRKKPDGLKNET